MSNYIDADALIVEVRGNISDHAMFYVQEAVDELSTADVEPVKEWIPCSEQLPEKCTKVLFCNGIGTIHIGWWANNMWWNSEDWTHGAMTFENIVYWMPLPELPRKDECRK